MSWEFITVEGTKTPITRTHKHHGSSLSQLLLCSLWSRFGCCFWHSAARLNLSTLTLLVLSYGCLCPASSSSSSSSSSPAPVSSSCLRATLAAAPAPLEGPCEPASPVTSHQCRAGMRRGPGPGRGHHSGGWEGGGSGGGGGWWLSRCSVGGTGDEIMLMSRPQPSIVVGGDMDTKGHREPVGVPL